MRRPDFVRFGLKSFHFRGCHVFLATSHSLGPASTLFLSSPLRTNFFRVQTASTKMDARDDIDIDPEIAAAMGFSSFGNPLSNKKRKFNHQDTFMDASKPKSSGTGANSMQLGARQKKIPSISTLRSSQQDDKDGEEWLDPGYVEESVDMNELSLSADTVLPPQTNPSNFEPVNRASPRPKGKQNQSGPSGLAQFLARGEAFKQDVLASENGDFGTKHSLDAVFPSDHSLPTEPTASIPSIPLGTFGCEDTHVLRKGVRNAQGDVAYFLPSFVEDPWENQRKERK